MILRLENSGLELEFRAPDILRPGDHTITREGDVYRITRVVFYAHDHRIVGFCQQIDPKTLKPVADTEDPRARFGAVIGFVKHFARHGISFYYEEATRQWAKDCLRESGIDA